MKALIVLIALGAAVYFIGPKFGLEFNKGDSEAVLAYKEFMDAWIVNDYDRAAELSTGSAASKVSNKRRSRKILSGMFGQGALEASRIKVKEEVVNGDSVLLTVFYSASISWEGSTANSMSPKSWKHFNQEGRVEKVNDGWKVSSFTSERSDGK